MMFRSYLSVLFLLTFGNLWVFAGQYGYSETISYANSDFYDSHDIAASKINCIAQCSAKFIWFGTDNGLIRYDGYEFKTYRSDLKSPSIFKNNRISSIAEGPNGRLWIGTRIGLYSMEIRRGSIVPAGNEYLDSCKINHVDAAKDGRIWLATDESLCCYIPQDSLLKRYRYPQLGHIPNDLLCDSHGWIWLTFPAYGLLRFDPATETFIQYPQVTKGNNVMTLIEDCWGNYWFSCWEQGIFRMYDAFSPAKVKYENYRHDPANPGSIKHNTVYDIIQNPATGKIWVLTKGGISVLDTRYAPDSFEEFAIENRSPFDRSREYESAFFDVEGNLWLSSKTRGLTKISFTNENIKEVYINFLNKRPLVRSIHQFQNGNIWVAVDDRGILEKESDESEFKRISDNTLRYLNKVSQITPIDSGTALFIGSFYRGGFLTSLDAKGNPSDTRKMENWPDSEIANNIKVFDDTDRYVVTTDNQVCVVSREKRDSILLRYNIHGTTAFAKNGNDHWIGTSTNGLYRLSMVNGSLRTIRYNMSDGNLNSNTVLSLFTDHAGNLWVGTQGGGLSLFNKETARFELVNSKFNIHSSDIFNICQSPDQDLWFCSENEIMRLPFSEGVTPTCQVIYSSTKGIDNIEFIPNSYCCGTDGKLYFGGINGYVEVNPNHANAEMFRSNTIVTDIRIDGKSIFFHGSTHFTLDKNMRMTVFLNQNSNNIQIDFSSMWMRNSNMSRYAYKLEGVDVDWQINEDGQNFAIYNNLRKGSYVFKVRTINDSDGTERSSAGFTVVVKPSVFDTTLAHLIYIVAGIGIFLLIAILIMRNFRITTVQHQILLEKKRSEELNELKIKFFTNISHELLTPLSIISCGVENLFHKCHNEDTQEIEILKANISRLTRLIRQVLELKKIESGNIRLKVSYGDASSFIENICLNNFKPLIRENKIQFSYLCVKREICGFFDKDKLDKIIYNLLSNAFKYNHKFGHVNVIVDEIQEGNNRCLKISVKDDGDGISKERQTEIFNRYTDGDYRKFNTTGTGIGLSLTKDLITLHHGRIDLVSDTGKGCEFIVMLPLDADAYSEQEIERGYNEVREHSEPSQDPNMAAGDSDKKNILIVEDSEDLRYMMKNVLKDSFNIYCAENGKEGIESLHLHEVDLIISDIMMPVMDGLAMAQIVRDDITTSHIPIIILTAKSNEDDMLDSYKKGVDDYLVKPVNVDILKIKIEKLLEKRNEDSLKFRRNESTGFISHDEKFLSKAISIISRNMNNDSYSFDMFFNDMNVSKSTLYRKIKVLTGMSPSDFIRNIRLKKACEIIKAKKVSVAEIAYEVGFNDSKYFSVCFKKEFGVTPTEYISRYHIPEGQEKTTSQ